MKLFSVSIFCKLSAACPCRHGSCSSKISRTYRFTYHVVALNELTARGNAIEKFQTCTTGWKEHVDSVVSNELELTHVIETGHEVA